MERKIRALSLFANVGIAETYLKDLGVDVVVANEIEKKRADFYTFLYPDTKMIVGDITESEVFKKVVTESKKQKVNLIMATPPCQGMSTAGKKDKKDVRNFLIKYAVDMIKEIRPEYVFLENVPEQLITKINYKNQEILIPEYVKKELSAEYNFNHDFVINAADYGVPQMRERAIMLLTRKDKKYMWEFPEKCKKVTTLEGAIGDLPSLDPELYDLPYDKQIEIFPEFEKKKLAGLEVSKWHYPPKHIYRQVYSLMHTPTGCTAFDNVDKFKPKKKDGTLVRGFKNTYKRQSWDKPGYTITMYNRTIGSQNNVHPGRLIGKDAEGYEIYSDARVLTVYELMIVSSLPRDWQIPEWASEHFVRQVIGEGVPPLLVKKIMQQLVEQNV